MSATAFQRMRREKAKTKNTEMKEKTQHVEIIEKKVVADGQGTSEAGRQEGHETEEQPKTQGPAEPVNTEGQAAEGESLSELTVPELKERAKEREVAGYSTMKRDELLEALDGE